MTSTWLPLNFVLAQYSVLVTYLPKVRYSMLSAPILIQVIIIRYFIRITIPLQLFLKISDSILLHPFSAASP